MFESSLKRMSALCRISENTNTSYRVLTKGAPEVLKKYMVNLPKDYD
jgi:magnesium-transporting ATPase (P-type)